MCIHFRPPDPLPEPMRPPSDHDALTDDVIALAIAWVDANLSGVITVAEARTRVRIATERLQCIARMRKDRL